MMLIFWKYYSFQKLFYQFIRQELTITQMVFMVVGYQHEMLHLNHSSLQCQLIQVKFIILLINWKYSIPPQTIMNLLNLFAKNYKHYFCLSRQACLIQRNFKEPKAPYFQKFRQAQQKFIHLRIKKELQTQNRKCLRPHPSGRPQLDLARLQKQTH